MGGIFGYPILRWGSFAVAVVTAAIYLYRLDSTMDIAGRQSECLKRIELAPGLYAAADHAMAFYAFEMRTLGRITDAMWEATPLVEKALAQAAAPAALIQSRMARQGVESATKIDALIEEYCPDLGL